MPYYRKKSYRKKYSRKRTYRKKFSRKRNSGMGQGGKRYFKLSISATCLSSGAGTLTDTFGNDPTGLNDWTPVSQLFDDYKVCAIKVQYIPDIPNGSSITTSYQPVYIVGDNNDAAAATGANQIMQQEAFRVKNLWRPWKYYWKFQWKGNTALSKGYRSVNDTNATQNIRLWASGLDFNTTYGRYIITHYIVAKNRQ